MGVIGVFDSDYFHYTNVMPNLECAKLVTYYRNHNEIAVLTSQPNYDKFSKVYYRKEYNDGIFPKDLIRDKCEYGGRAFSPNRYVPLPKEIEMTAPNMHVYDSVVKYFNPLITYQRLFARILNCAHIRLAPYGEVLPEKQLRKMMPEKYSGIFLHDYDIASLDAFELIKSFSEERTFRLSGEPNPYPVGNKYPIKIYSSEELQKWSSLTVLPNLFYLEYCGLIDNTVLQNLCLDNRRMARQIDYNITYGCSSENEFLVQRLPKIFLQVLLLRKLKTRFLLTYDEGFFVTPELETLIRLWNNWLRSQWQKGQLKYETLVDYCHGYIKQKENFWFTRFLEVDLEDVRKSFLYIREKNYDLFKMFYQWDDVRLEGGEIVDDLL